MNKNTGYNVNQIFCYLKYKLKLILFHLGMSDDALLFHSDKWPWKLTEYLQLQKGPQEWVDEKL